ncbi:DUF6488 family protein [Pseudoteredinibacter isoporae]|uniref:Uncharacterized protein n=1 Tax=Pseudoteredinibacter isoporae TaxID=570281 RepID=A0A7X0JQV5_9GAMM|nr:DUF6488 family protein [Pseudoteredinibacter isoporae]MBB6519983.1 hypothetical protein [Pseudoteredinibacter isoporae]NHO85555.1 hypothetical protein [Pseudoteredinibacter isoporae]NIB25993.1 hypothetical protein [Pseudoteredinibacter isoporae]
MKKYLSLVLFIVISCNSQWLAAHADHGFINAGQAKSIALSMTKKLSIKDLGYSVGKLDSSWKKIKSSDLTVLPSDSGKHQVRVNNAETQQAIIVSISANGDVLSVKPQQEK